MHRITRFALLVALAATVNAHASAGDTVRRNFNAADGGTLVIESDLGTIDVTTGGTGVAIEIVRTVHGSGDRAAAVLKNNETRAETSICTSLPMCDSTSTLTRPPEASARSCR
jgi:hypothetical protein